jgi:hypothetical protein
MCKQSGFELDYLTEMPVGEWVSLEKYDDTDSCNYSIVGWIILKDAGKI